MTIATCERGAQRRSTALSRQVNETPKHCIGSKALFDLVQGRKFRIHRIGRIHDHQKTLQKYMSLEFFIHSILSEHVCAGILPRQPWQYSSVGDRHTLPSWSLGAGCRGRGQKGHRGQSQVVKAISSVCCDGETGRRNLTLNQAVRAGSLCEILVRSAP